MPFQQASVPELVLAECVETCMQDGSSMQHYDEDEQ